MKKLTREQMEDELCEITDFTREEMKSWSLADLRKIYLACQEH